MKTKKKFLALSILFVGVLIGYFSYQLLFPKARDISQEKTDYKINAEKLQEEMSVPNASVKYIDKVIELEGQLTTIAQHYIMVNNKIQVRLKENGKQSLSKGKTILVKGRCVGYDDLLEEVKIDQATIIKVE